MGLTRSMAGSGTIVSLSETALIMQAAAPKTTMIRKIDCQPNRPSAIPPMVGDSAGPMASIMPMRFMIPAARSPVNWSRTMARATVMPAEAPMPCTSRPASSTSTVGASAAIRLPAR